MRFFALAIAFCCFMLAGCGPATVNSLVKDKDARQMSGRAILDYVRGNTLSLHSFNEDFQLYFESSGKLFAKAESNESDKGSWDVSEDGELCFRMHSWWYADLRCFQVYAVGEKNNVRLANSSGVLQYSAEQEQGNSKLLGDTKTAERKKKSLLHASGNGAGGSDSDTGSADQPGFGGTRAARPVIEETAHSDHAAKDTSTMLQLMAKECPGCKLAEADLSGADLAGAKLNSADLHGANLSKANARYADLQKANLRNANLTDTNLIGADLRGADLRGAKLKGANLTKADFSGAKLDGADLAGTVKEGTKGLK